MLRPYLVLRALLCLFTPAIAHADGLTAAQLQGQFAAQPSTSPNGIQTERSRALGAENAIAAIANAAMPQSGGNSSATLVTGLAAGMKGGQSLARLFGNFISLQLFAGQTATGNIGNASIVATVVDNPAGSSSLVLPYIPSSETASIISTNLGVWRVSGPAIQSGGNVTIPISTATTVDVPAGTSVALVQQDDFPAMLAAKYNLAPANGGSGGSVFIPPGIYYFGTGLTDYDRVAMWTAGGASLAPGSQASSATPCAGCFWGNSFAIAAETNSLAGNVATFNQHVTANPGQQVNDLFLPIVLDNANGGGSVGIEINQSIGSTQKTGLLFGYHSVQHWAPGQDGASIAAEFEIQNNSGVDMPTLNQNTTKGFLHLDDLGTTPVSFGIKFGGGGRSLNSGTHVGFACEPNYVFDWCEAVYRIGASTSTLADIAAGIRPDGTFLTTGLTNTGSETIAGPLAVGSGPSVAGYDISVAGSAYTGGDLVSAQELVGSGVNISGRQSQFSVGQFVDPQTGVQRDAKFGSLGIAWSGGAYGDSLTISGAARISGGIVSGVESSHTVTQSDCGGTIRVNSQATATLTVPSNLPVGCKIDVIQAGVANVLFSATAGETLETFGGMTHTAGQWAKAEILVDTSGSFLISGNLQ